MKVKCPNCGVSFNHRSSALTAAEQRVYDQLIAGRSLKEIAAALGRSERTIDTHKRAIFAKRGVHKLGELFQQHYGPAVDEWI